MLYNLDTSIWLDYYEKRNGAGEYAKKLINKIIRENNAIIYSNIHIAELKNQGYSIDQIYKIFRIVQPDNMRKVHTSLEQINAARTIAAEKRLPKGDVLQAILSRDNFAIMVTKDRHFKLISYIAEPKRPEELI